MTTHGWRLLIPFALAFSIFTLFVADPLRAAESDRDSTEPRSHERNPRASHPPSSLVSPDTLGSAPSRDLYGNFVYPSQEWQTPAPEFSNPSSKSSGPVDSRPWDYHTPSRGCIGEGC